MVSIAAFQAVDPGSIPGHRMIFLPIIIGNQVQNNKNLMFKLKVGESK
jgi:hypothetical protein